MFRLKRRVLLIVAGVALVLIALACNAQLGSIGEQVLEDGENAEREDENVISSQDGNTGASDNEVNTTLPAAPSNLGGDHVPVFDVSVNWTDNSDNEDGFNLYRFRTDAFEVRKFAGVATPNETQFTDERTYCGATYRYIVASYNDAGESPEQACWEVTLPACPQNVDLDPQGFGPTNGITFANRTSTDANDIYLALDDSGQALLMADGHENGGLLELGDIGDTPLERVTIPEDATYVSDGVSPQVGSTYVARTADPSTLAVFTINSFEDALNLTFILWQDSPLTTRACSAEDTVLATRNVVAVGLSAGDDQDRNIPGDDFCVPYDEYRNNCPIAELDSDSEGRLRRIGEEEATVEESLELYEELECTDVLTGPVEGIDRERVFQCYVAGAHLLFPGCFPDEEGVDLSAVRDELVEAFSSERIPERLRERAEALDADCEDSACVSVDGICNAECQTDTTCEQYGSYQYARTDANGNPLCCSVPEGNIQTQGGSCIVVGKDLQCEPPDQQDQPNEDGVILQPKNPQNGEQQTDVECEVIIDNCQHTSGPFYQWDEVTVCRDETGQIVSTEREPGGGEYVPACVDVFVDPDVNTGGDDDNDDDGGGNNCSPNDPNCVN